MFSSSRVFQVTALLALSVGAGTLLYVTTRYFKRKRREPSTGKSSSYNDRPLRRNRRIVYTSGGSRLSIAGPSRVTSKGAGLEQESGIFPRHRSSVRSQPTENVDNLAVDERVSEDSAVDLAEDVIMEENEMIEELIKTGVKNFEMALEHWYEAAECVITQREQNTLHNDNLIFEAEEKLTALISNSRKLQRVIKHYDLSVMSLPCTPTNMLTWIDDDSIQEQLLSQLSNDADDDPLSDTESFVSASDNAQLEFDDLADERFVNESHRLKLFRETVLSTAGSHSHLEFYVSGLQHYIRYGIPCRTMRTNVVGCESDMEFLAKVYCLRKASKVVFSSKETCQWFISSGREAVSSVIESASKDPSDFQAAFDELIQYTSSSDNWKQIKEELTERGVKEMSFYDVLLDFVLMDAFDDLETPPYTVATAVQNRWLSARIKETALTTAIWGVLKAKTSYLQDPYGFMAHFYVVAQYVSPLLAWGFMGTDEELKQVCEYFKSHIIGFVKDLFNFDTADYSSIESLCDSILRLAKERFRLLIRKRVDESLADDLEITDPFNQVGSANV